MYLKSSKRNEDFYTDKYQDHIPCSFSYKLVCVESSKKTFVYRGGNVAYRFVETISKEYEYCKKINEKVF